MDPATRLHALANPKRLAVVGWLKMPSRHWRDHPSAPVGPLGVSCTAITRKLQIAPASTTRHMQILAAAGLVQAHREGKFTYYRLAEGVLERLADDLLRL